MLYHKGSILLVLFFPVVKFAKAIDGCYSGSPGKVDRGLDRTEIRTTSFKIEWTAKPDETYRLFVTPTLDSPPEMPSNAEVIMTSPLTIETLTNGSALEGNKAYDCYLYVIQSGTSTGFDCLRRLSTFSDPPSNIQISNKQADSIEVSWIFSNPSASQQADQYEIKYTPTSGGQSKTETVNDVNTQQRTINDLNTNTDYDVTVTAWRTNGIADSLLIYSDDSNVANTFSKPSNLEVSGQISSSLIVNWNQLPVHEPTTLSGFIVTWLPPDNGGSKVVPGHDTTSFTITGLIPNTEYSVQVAAQSSAGGTGAFSDLVKQTTVFGQSASLSTTSSSSSIDVSWTGPGIGGNAEKVSKYNITWSPPNSNGVTSHNTAATAIKYTIPDLVSNTDYNINIYAVSDAGYGDGCGIVQTTDPLRVFQPRNSSVATVNSITLQWTPVEGDSPSLRYNVEWNPSGSTESSISVVETSTTISGLNASTSYTFTVIAVNGGGSADPSDQAMFSTLCSQPEPPTLSRPSSNSTTQINVEWTKPSGGDDIVDYVVDWWLLSSDGSMTSSGIVSGATTSSYTIEGLTPGETYDVTVKARNSAGAGQSSSGANHTTNPNSVKNLLIEQNSGEPDKILDLTWATPNGTGDNIMIEYRILTEHTMNTTSVEFEISQTSLSVVPGNNYTVTVTVRSKGYESTPESIDTNSKPSEPSFEVEPFTNELQVTWTSPDGYYEGVAIYFNNTEIVVGDSGTYNLTGLKPYTDYEVEMYSQIINIYGVAERSLASPKPYKTFPGPPPQPIFNPSLTDNAKPSVNTITFVLPSNTFSEENGPIEYYGVYLVIGDPLNSSPNLTNVKSCESLASGDECVTLWTDDQGNLVQGGAPQKTKKSVLTRQTGLIEFIIGDGSVTLSPWNVEYQNHPLQPNTGYRVAVAAKTGNQKMTATEFYPTITTGSGSDSTGLIIGLVCAAIVIVAGIVGGMYYYRRRRFHKKEHSYVGSTTNILETPPSVPPMTNASIDNTNITKNDTSRSILTSQFEDYMRQMKGGSYTHLIEEYEELKDVGVEQSTSEAIKPENYTKNRYKKNILPYDVTRVKLDMIGDEPGTDFIHANYIPGYNKEKEFIATQGPLPTTKEDFWRMIWEQNSRNIVMLTQIVEGERVKCDHYWPYNNEPVVMAGIAVKLVAESTSKDWAYRELMLLKDSEQRLVTQFHYTAWPDHGVPETAENLVKFVRYFQRKVSRETRDCGPITVHCSAGVGRTGTFIAMDRLLQHMKDHDYVDIFGIVHEMRMCRVAMVQTDKQYILLHEMVQDVINQVYDATDEVPVYENTMQSPIYENAAFYDLHS